MQLMGVVKAYAAPVGPAIKDTILEPKVGKFQTVVLIG